MYSYNQPHPYRIATREFYKDNRLVSVRWIRNRDDTFKYSISTTEGYVRTFPTLEKSRKHFDRLIEMYVDDGYFSLI